MQRLQRGALTAANNNGGYVATRQEIISQLLAQVDGAAPQARAPLAKHLKMAANPLRFMRGAAALFYRDLAAHGGSPLPAALGRDIPLTTVQGDCHLANFGFSTEEGSHGDRVIFSPNDFDDACIGHAVWDLLRFAASLYLAADYLRGVSDGRYQREEDVDLMARDIPDERMARRAGMRFLDSYVDACDDLVDEREPHHQVLDAFPKGHVLRPLWKKATKRAAGGKDFTRKSSLARACVWQGGDIRFDPERPGFAEIPKEVRDALETHFAPFVDDRILDVVARLDAGTGSLNMGRYYLLVGPVAGQYPRDLPLCHIVEVKQQRRAAPLGFFDDLSPVNRLNPAHLTQVCQRRMQRQPDLVLDEAPWRDSHWLVRSRHHAKVGVGPEDLLAEEAGIVQYGASCGRALALAHSRGDRRSTRFEQAVCKTLPRQRECLLDASLACAEQTLQDWRLLSDMLHR